MRAQCCDTGICLHITFNANASWGLTRHLSLLHFSADHRVHHYAVLSIDFKKGFKAAFKQGDQRGVRQPAAINLLFTLYSSRSFYLIFFSSYPSLLASRRCKRLADRTRWYFVWWWAITLSFKDWKILGFSKGRWTFSNDSVYNPSLSDAYPNK